MATLLLDFDQIGAIPPSVILSRLNSKHWWRFRLNKANWHRSCIYKFNIRELQRKCSSVDKTCTSSSLADQPNILSELLGDEAWANSIIKRQCSRSDIIDKMPGLRLWFFCDMTHITLKNENILDRPIGKLHWTPPRNVSISGRLLWFDNACE